MKLFIILATLFIGFSVSAENYECKQVQPWAESAVQVCFPVNHKCYDNHGIGDGKPIQIDCWSHGSRACNPSLENWPKCAGGIIANECKDVEIESKTEKVCFPVGHTCYDNHGIGDGVPVKIDCWTGVTRLCNKSSDKWPMCFGGKVLD